MSDSSVIPGAIPGPALRLGITGAGVTLDPATGTVGVAIDRLREGLELTVTSVGGAVLGSFRVTIQAVAPALPRPLAAPALVGSGVIGEPLAVDPGSWEGADALALQWCRDGAAIEAATGPGYLPVPEDDRGVLTCRVTARNGAGETAAETAPVAVRYAAPSAAALADVELLIDGDGSVDAAAAFTGAGLSYAVSGAGATIDAATGAVGIPAAALLPATTVTVTATNSGGSATVSFQASVKGIAPAVVAVPKLGGPGKIGTALSLDPGSWSGNPVPALTQQWRRGGADIAGATGASYLPVAADDRAALTCRVTATNAAGEASAGTEAVTATWPAPVASGTLPDLDLVLGAAAGSVAAAAAFTGAGLSYAVSGAGATIDAATGAVGIPAAALLPATTVTVTATNSGGSATVSFQASVKGIAPAVVAVPKLGGPGKIGTALSLDPGTWSGNPVPALTQQWRRGGADIAGATGASYLPVAADDRAALTCRVTATNAAGEASAGTEAVTATWPAPVASGTLPDLDLVLGAAAGSVAAAAAFTGAGLSYAVSGAGATIDAATGAVGIPAAALLPATTVTVTATNSGGSATVSFQASVKAVEDPVPTDPIAALGTPSADFKAVAVAAQLVAPASSGTAMNGTYSANSLVALGVACIKGDTGAARDRALEQARWMLNAGARNPLNCGAFPDNVCALFSAMLVLMKQSPAWALLGATERARADAAMKVHAFSGAFVAADANPWYPSKPRTLRGYPATGGSNQKKTVFNQSGMGPCSLLIAMAYFGGPAKLKALLATTTPAALRAELADLGLSGGNLHRTMNWRNVGYADAVGMGGDLSANAPTDAQIVAAAANPKWFGHDLADYHRILAMLTFTREAGVDHKPWVGNGSYGTEYGGAGSNTGNPVLIGRGWGGAGLDASGSPVASGAVQGVMDADAPNPPGLGLTGAPAELFCEQDEGKRSSPHYAVEGMRPLVATWLALWATGLLDRNNADIQAVLPVMDRAVRCLEHVASLTGFASWDHASASGHWPHPTQDWQRHAAGASLGGAAGGNLFTTWTEVLGPALGCGQVARNGGFASTDGWTGFGANGKSVSGGKAVFNVTPAASPISQPVPLIPGKYYQVQHTIAGRKDGNPFPYLSGGTQRNGTRRTANGTYKERLLVNPGNDTFGLQGGSGPQTYTLGEVSLTGPFETATVDGN